MCKNTHFFSNVENIFFIFSLITRKSKKLQTEKYYKTLVLTPKK